MSGTPPPQGQGDAKAHIAAFMLNGVQDLVAKGAVPLLQESERNAIAGLAVTWVAALLDTMVAEARQRIAAQGGGDRLIFEQWFCAALEAAGEHYHYEPRRAKNPRTGKVIELPAYDGFKIEMMEDLAGAYTEGAKVGFLVVEPTPAKPGFATVRSRLTPPNVDADLWAQVAEVETHEAIERQARVDAGETVEATKADEEGKGQLLTPSRWQNKDDDDGEA